jgi:peptidoglycan/LPS O-acetylase OafA/YrhL
MASRSPFEKAVAVERYAHLDGLRGIAAAIVLASHTLGYFWHAECYGAGPVKTAFGFAVQKTPLALLLNGHAAVVCFFVLSGFVLSKRHLRSAPRLSAVAGDLAKRPFRLILAAHPSAVVAATLMFGGFYQSREAGEILDSPTLATMRSECSAKELVKAVIDPLVGLTARFNEVGWTLFIEFWASYATYCIVVATGAFSRRQRAQVLAVIAGLFVLASRTNENAAVGYVVFFICGIACADNEDQLRDVLWGRRSLGSRLLLWTPFVCLFLVMASVPHHSALRKESIVPAGMVRALDGVFVGGPSAVLGVMAFVAAVVVPPLARALSTKLPRYLGRISVGLYLIHLPIIAVVGSFLVLWTSSGGAPPDHPTKAWITVVVALVAILGGQVYSAVFDDWAVRTSRTVGAKVTAAYETLRLG